MILSEKAIESAFEELKKRSDNADYLNDPVGWARDVLGVKLWSKQREILESLVTNKKTAVKSSHAIGKGVTKDTPIPTPTGMRLFGELREGDYVLDVHGNPTLVTYVSPDKYLDNYEVVFDDGTVIQCDADHLWQVQDLTKRRRKVSDWRDHWGNTITKNVVDLKNSLRTESGQYRWRVPIAGALQKPHNLDLPIDPYLLGVWLGDGTTTSGVISGGSTKTFYETLSPDEVTRADSREHVSTVYYRSPQLHDSLQASGLLGNKHIPHEYLWNTSETQRRDLLAGLMDSDGFVGTSSGIDLTDKRLTEDVMRLLLSLGVKASLREGDAGHTKNGIQTVTGTRYRISFTTTWNPFRNRGENWTPPKTSKHSIRTIVDIRQVESEITRCITVENELSCFLIGNEFVPTHNTFLSAVAVCWWVSTRPNGVVRTTAPTSYQVGQLLWKEIRTMHARNSLVGEVNQNNEWKTNVNGAINVVASGQKPSDTSIHSFHGVHATDGVLTVLDEGCGIVKALFTAADAISTGLNDRVLTVGNPDDPNTPFGEIFLNVTEENKRIWNRITVSAFDTPNFTGEEVPDIVRQNLIQPDWVEERGIEWGVDSGRYKSKILGEFPDQSDNSFFTQQGIDKAYDTEIDPDTDAPLILGVDIAGGGEDDTVIYSNRAGHIRKVISWSNGDAVFLARRILDEAIRLDADEIRIDNGGFGKGVIDMILTDPRCVQFTIIRMMGGDQASDPSAHRNKRAENYDHLRMSLDRGLVDLDPSDTKVKEQMLGVRYEYTERGAIKLEAKADIRKRSGKSPDDLDAIVYAFADLSFLDESSDKTVNHLDPRDYFDDIPAWATNPW